MDNSEATQLLKKLLKVDRTDGETSSLSLDGLQDGILSGDHINTRSATNSVNGTSPYMCGQQLFDRPARVRQQIYLQGTDVKNSHGVYGQDVEVFVSPFSSVSQLATGSSKVKINTVVKFDWEHRCYVGNLIAVHLNQTHVAYVLRAPASSNVRVYNRKTAERTLIKGFNGRVVDIAFAFTSSVTIGIVDELGGVFVYDINESSDGKISTSLRLHCGRPSGVVASEYHRLIWCNFIPDNTDSLGTGSPTEDGSMLMMVTHNNVAEIWNVDDAAKSQLDITLSLTDDHPGHRVINEHAKAIVDGVFSPDGLHLATASLDGYVKFYEICRDDDIDLRCEQTWQPHGGRPLACLFFLDDLKHQSSESLWTFLITGTADKLELKIWSTETWTCLQTITFEVPPGMSPSAGDSWLRAGLDLSASYLVLSDISRKVMYILQIYQDHEAKTAHVSSVSEFLLAQPILSFAVIDAGRRRLAKAQEYDAEDVWSCTTGEVAHDDDDEEVPASAHGSDIGVLVRLYAIHTKAMQELQIRYQPESSVAHGSISSTSESGLCIHDLLSDISAVSNDSRHMSSSSRPCDVTSPLSRNSPPPVLMTPNAFTSSRLSDESAHEIQSSISSSLTLVTAMDDDTDGTLIMHTPHSAKGPLSLADAEAVKKLPTVMSDLFPTPMSEVPSSSTFADQFDPADNLKMMEDSAAEADDEDTFRARMQHKSESSVGSSEAGNEVNEIMDSGRRSNGLNDDDVNLPRSPSPAYNDDAIASDEEGSAEADIHDSEQRLNSLHDDWRAESHEHDSEQQEIHADSHPSGFVTMEHSGEDVLDKCHTSDEFQNSRQQMSSADSQGSVHRPAHVDHHIVQEMQQSLQQMVQLLQLQQQEVAQLRTEVTRQRNLGSAIDQLTLQVDALAATVTARITEVLHEKSHQDFEHWRQALSDVESRSQQLHSDLELSVSRSIGESVRVQLDNAIRTEFANSVIPRINQILEPVKEQLHTELAQKLTATDTALKDSISKLVRSKQTMETLSQSTATALQSALQTVCRDVLLPSFDRACQNMFQQISTVFQQGSQEYVRQLESHLEHLRRRRDDARDPVLHQMRSLVDTLQRREQASESNQTLLGTAVETLQKTTTQISADNSKLEGKLLDKLNERHDALLGQLRQIVQREVTAALHSQQSVLTERLELALRSGAATPVPTPNDPQQLQQQIHTLVRQGKVNAAFQQALSATDLSLVMMVCRACDPGVVFSDRECPLTQPVLLSLIQQLSANFDSDVELKHRYLEEALLKLDQTNPVTREHVASVLRQLCAKLGSYIQSANPKDKMYHSMSKLLSICDIYLRGCLR